MLQRFLTTFFGLFFPRFCCICSRQGALLCSLCAVKVLESYPKTPKTIVLPHTGLKVFPNFYYNYEVEDLLLMGKEEGLYILLQELGAWWCKYLQQEQNELQQLIFNSTNSVLLVPIPLLKDKQKLRGYNQVRQLLNGFCQVARSPTLQVINLLERGGKITTQRGLGREERAQQVASKFVVEEDYFNTLSLAEKAILKTRPIILVDDVITTGSTLESAAICLQQAGFTNVIAGMALLRA